MIKSTVINRIKIILGLGLIFLLSYILEVNLIIPLFLVCFFLYLKLTSPDYKLLHLALLFVIIFTASYAIIQQHWPTFYIPFAAIPMLSAILFSELEISLLLTLVSAVSIAYLARDVYLGILFLISGLIASILVRNSALCYTDNFSRLSSPAILAGRTGKNRLFV